MKKTTNIEDIRKDFDCIVGYEPVKEELIQICDTIINRDFYTRLGADIPRGLLLLGMPGVGKTTMAECVASACGQTVFRLRKPAFGGNFIENIKSTFEAAAAEAPAIILLDDLDKYCDSDEDMFYMSSDMQPATNTEYAVLQSCIDSFEDKDVFIIATANESRDLPPSLIRSGRFDRVRTVYPPGVHDAELILGKYLGEKKLAKDVDFRRLAVLANGRSCAYIETLANDAGVIAGYEGSPEITMDHIARAYLRWHSCKRKEKLTPEEKRRVAYHEAGHIVVMEHLMPGIMDIVTARRENRPLIDLYMDGLLLGIHDDRNRMAALKALGGRAAIELVYGEVAEMSEYDISTACFHAGEKVRNGYDDYLHLLQNSTGEGSSEEIMVEVEDAIAAELEGFYREAMEIVRENRAFLDRLADALCENEYLLAEDISRIAKGSGHSGVHFRCKNAHAA